MTTRSDRFRCLALAVMLSVGAGLIWGVVFGFGFGIVESMISSPGTYEQLLFTRGGTPIIQSYAGANYEARTNRTLDGKPVELASNDLEYRQPLRGPVDPRKRFFNLSWSQRIAGMRDNWYDPEVWYCVHDGKLDGHGYVVGYDSVAKARIGYIGRNGFRSTKPPREEQFPINGRRVFMQGPGAVVLYCFDSRGNMKHLATDDGLVQIDVKKRTAKVVPKETNLISAAASHEPQSDAEATSGEAAPSQTILLRTPERVLVLDPSGKEIQTYLLPAGLRDGDLVFIPLQGDKALVHQGSELLWIDTAGKILERRRVDLRDPRKMSNMGNAVPSLVVSIGVPSVGIIAGVFACYPWGPAESESLGYWAAVGKGLGMYWPLFLITGAIGVALAVLCYRRQRRYGLPWTWVWTGFVLLFGVPAYLGYLAHRSWPARLPCPNCGKPAPRDREACVFCNHDFPAPPPKGIEVFA